jgi:GT2 family glycosyltransferase
MSDPNTAVIVVNYNMPERTDALVGHILDTVHLPYQMIVVDNGSDLVDPSSYTTLHLPKNRQTTGGFIAGMRYAELMDQSFDYYWMFITSSEFKKDDRDALEILINVMKSDKKTYAVSPAFTFNWSAFDTWMCPREGKKPRRVFGIDYLAALIDRRKLEQIGGFRKEVTMMWGVHGECNMLARKNGWHIYVHDGYVMHKESNIGYKMDRMNMTAEDRASQAQREKEKVYIPIYGENFEYKFRHAYRETKDGDY